MVDRNMYAFVADCFNSAGFKFKIEDVEKIPDEDVIRFVNLRKNLYEDFCIGDGK